MEERVLLNVEIESTAALKALVDLKDQSARLRAEQKELDLSTESGRARYQALAVQIKSVNAEAARYEKQIQNDIKQQNAQTNSINQLRSRLSNLTAAYNSLSEAERKSTSGMGMRDEIASLTSELSSAEQELGNFHRQVGNYEVAGRSMRQELRELTEQMVALKLQGEGNSAAFQELNARAAQIKDAMSDVQSQVRNAANDTMALSGAIQLVSTGISAFSAVVSAFGVPDEYKQFLVLMQRCQTLMQALQALQKAFQKESAMMVMLQGAYNKALSFQATHAAKAAAAETARTAAMNGGSASAKVATTVQWAWNAALSANPLMLLVTAITAAVAAIGLITNKLRDAKKETVDYMASVNKLRGELSNLSDIRNYERRLQKAQGASERELLEGDIEAAAKELELARTTMRKWEKDKDESVRLKWREWTDEKQSAYEAAEKTLQETEKRWQDARRELIIYDAEQSTAAAKAQREEEERKAEEAKRKAAERKAEAAAKETVAEPVETTVDDSARLAELERLAAEAKSLLKKTTEEEVAAVEEKYRLAAANVEEYYSLVEEEYSGLRAKIEQEGPLGADADVTEAERSRYEELSAILMSYEDTKKRLEAQSAEEVASIRAEAEQAERDSRLNAIQEQLDVELKLAGENIDAQMEARQRALESQLAAGLLAEEEYNKASERLAKESAAAKVAAFEDAFSKVSDKVSGLLNGANDLWNAIEDRQLSDYEENQAAEQAALDARLSSGLISQEQYEEQKQRLEAETAKKKAEIERKQAIRAKALAIMEATVNTATAIMKIWAEVPKFDFGISTNALTAIAAAMGAMQIAAIAAEPLPKASRGMLLRGPSHAAGGIMLEAEGGEAIINKRSTAQFRDILSEINAWGGGVRFAQGGLVGGMSSRLGQSGSLVLSQDIVDGIASALGEMRIYTALTDIHRAEGVYAKVEGLR